MGKGSLAKISAALAIISLYIYLFGIMGTIEGMDKGASEEQSAAVEAFVTTTSAPEETITERVVNTYATQPNAAVGKKPQLNNAYADEDFDDDFVITSQASDEASALNTLQAIVTTAPEAAAAATPFVTTTAQTTTTAAQTVTAAQTTTAATATTAETAAAATTPQTTTVTTTAATTTAATTTTTTTAQTTTAEATTTAATTTVTAETTAAAATSPETQETSAETNPPSWGLLPQETTASEDSSAAAEETLSVYTNGQVISGDAITIVASAVMGEISDVFDEEAIKAQAIAAYTHIKSYNLKGKNAYVVLRTPTEKVINCVSQVIGKALYYNGEMIMVVYCASSAGYTATAANVWGVDYPYLISRRTEFDELYDINYGRESVFTAEEMRAYVLRNTGIVLNDDPSSWFSITSRVDGNYVGGMTIGGLSSYTKDGKTVTIDGRVMREIIMELDLRSASFDISYDPASASFIFTTYGYGHGCGMSQHGANILASYYGYTCEQILEFYYPGTVIA